MKEAAAARKEASSGASGLDLSRVRSIDGVDVRGKRVLVRVDFNVPIENGAVADTTRLTRVLPTIAKLAREGAKVVVLSHLGRPKGQPTPDTSLRPVATKMQELMPGTAIRFAAAPSGDDGYWRIRQATTALDSASSRGHFPEPRDVDCRKYLGDRDA